MDLTEKSIVVMPVAHRPEFAALALECLGHTHFDVPILVFVDDVEEKLKDDFFTVFANHAPSNASLEYREPHIPVSSGCWNITQSIKDGRGEGADYVFLVEEDVMVRPNFFEYHWEKLAGGEFLASCGRKCPVFYERYPDIYTNPGSCLTGPLVDNMIPHLHDVFYHDTGKYLNETFEVRAPGIHGLDDGLIRRIIWQMNGKAAYQDPPACSHTGFMAYENRYDFCHVDHTAKVEDRVENLRNLFLTLDKNGPKGMYMRDFDPLSDEQKANLRSGRLDR